MEILGYIGSSVILLSIAMRNIKKLRMGSILGNSILASYGLMIHAYPVVMMNVAVVSVNIYHLLRQHWQKDYFLLNDTLKGHEFFIKNFLAFYRDDINKFFPDFSPELLTSLKDPKIYVISRQLVPVGLFIYEKLEAGLFKVHLDFACPEYRDFKNFKFITETRRETWKNLGLHTMLVESRVPAHQKYLRKMGFIPDARSPEIFLKRIDH